MANLHGCCRFSSAGLDDPGSVTQHTPQDHHDFNSQLIHTRNQTGKTAKLKNPADSKVQNSV
jgi:hypothetical protein